MNWLKTDSIKCSVKEYEIDLIIFFSKSYDIRRIKKIRFFIPVQCVCAILKKKKLTGGGGMGWWWWGGGES